jgi:hypothetical protein
MLCGCNRLVANVGIASRAWVQYLAFIELGESRIGKPFITRNPIPLSSQG